MTLKDIEAIPIDQVIMETSKPSDYKDEGELINAVWDAAITNIKADIIKEVNNCGYTADISTNNMCGTIRGYTLEEHKKKFPDMPDKHRTKQFCDRCQAKMKWAGVKESDLVGEESH